MNIMSITSPDICNGLGCRVTIWVAGCSHNCPGCHNKETHNYNAGKSLSDTEFYNGVIERLNKELDKPYIKGITLSGGDPLDQNNESLNQLLLFIKRIKIDHPNKDIWIYSGDVYENLVKHNIKKEILNECDILVDGPFIIDKKDVTIAFRGSTNQRIIDLKQTIKRNKVITLDI